MSNFSPLGQGQGIVDICTEIANGVFYVRMTQQYLHSAKIACRLVDKRRLCSSHRVRTVLSLVETDR